MILDPSDEILSVMYGRLTLSYSGKSYPVYTVVPKNTEYDYVLMASPELIEDSAKGNHEYECTQLFDIVVFGGERGSLKAVNSISSQIFDAIKDNFIVTPNFKQTVEPVIDSTNNFGESVEGGTIQRKLIRFRYNIQQI